MTWYYPEFNGFRSVLCHSTVCVASVLLCMNSLLGVMILASPDGYKNNVFANCKKYKVS